MSDKEEIVETIIRVVERTKTWRSTLATKYPNDRRNSRAVETLGMLAVEAPSLTDLQFRELEPHFNTWDSENWRNALNEAARSVAFHNRTKDLAAFLNVVLQNLTRVAA
jgi:hypothetical protein